MANGHIIKEREGRVGEQQIQQLSNGKITKFGCFREGSLRLTLIACHLRSLQLAYFCCRLQDFAKRYDIIKNERNKCVNLIQTSTQVSENNDISR